MLKVRVGIPRMQAMMLSRASVVRDLRAVIQTRVGAICAPCEAIVGAVVVPTAPQRALLELRAGLLRSKLYGTRQ